MFDAERCFGKMSLIRSCMQSFMCTDRINANLNDLMAVSCIV